MDILLKDTVDALSPCIPHSTQSISCDCSSQGTRDVRNDEAHGSTTESSDDTPEFTGRLGICTFCHAFFSQHLFEDASKLLITVVFLFGGGFSTEAEG